MLNTRGVKVTGTFNLIGSLPSDVHDTLVRAVMSVPKSCFFDATGSPLKKEVTGVDRAMAGALNECRWNVQLNYCPVQDCRFNVDLALPAHKVLIEIEKGNLPRLELDILKIASACLQNSKCWHFAVLVVPSSYIELRLEGRQSPYQYLQRLAPLIKPVLNISSVKGFLVIGYNDPRSDAAPNPRLKPDVQNARL